MKAGDLLFVIEKEPLPGRGRRRPGRSGQRPGQRANAELQLRRAEELVKNRTSRSRDGRPRARRRTMAQARDPGGAGSARSRRRSTSATPRSTRRSPAASAGPHTQRRQSGRAGQRRARDDRQPGSDLRHLPGQPAPAPGGAAAHDRRRRRAAVVRVTLPDGTLYDQPGKVEFPRRPGRPGHRHRDRARRVAQSRSGCWSTAQFVSVRVERGDADAGARGAAGGAPGRPGRPLRARRRRREQGRGPAGHARRRRAAPTGRWSQEGLKEGERVIVEGIQKVRPGMVVAAERSACRRRPPAPAAAKAERR